MAVIVVTAGACSSSDRTITLNSVPPTTTRAAATSSATTASPQSALAPAATTTLPPLTPANAPLVAWNGKQQYIHGANLPWFNFGRDFGGGPDDGGASSAETKTAVNAALRAAHDGGMNVVRWWLFPGDAGQFTVDARNLPTGFKQTVYQDIDAALELARANQIAYTFTLFSGLTPLPSTWLTDEGRQRVALVLAELFTRYRNNPQIMTWDVINEPEYEVWSGKVTAEVLRVFIAGIVDAAHATTSIPVSVGGASMDGLSLLTGLKLDYYTVHWYDQMKERKHCLACVTYADVRDALKIDKPIVVGEYVGSAGFGDRFEMWRQHGFAGAMPWSLLPDRTADRFSIDLVAAAAFAKEHGLR
ncbi:MAG: hypothetical protein ABIQ73_28590 [Acidimicrobiales bacterium]